MYSLSQEIRTEVTKRFSPDQYDVAEIVVDLMAEFPGQSFSEITCSPAKRDVLSFIGERARLTPSQADNARDVVTYRDSSGPQSKAFVTSVRDFWSREAFGPKR